MKIEYHVSPLGNDAFQGGLNTPFQTIQRAVEILSSLPEEKNETREITVYIHSGIYRLLDSIVLDSEISGSDRSSLTFSSFDGPVRIMGGPILNNFKKLEIEEIKDRLYPEVRDRIWQCNLSENGIRDLGSVKVCGFSRPDVPAPMELFCDGSAMSLARYPDADRFLPIKNVPTDQMRDGFHYDDDRPAKWKEDPDIWVFGYWMYDWANSLEQIDVFDKENRLVKLKPDYGNYGYKAGQRFYFYNVLEELDTPGEFYIDYARGLAYLYPPDAPETLEISASELEVPLLKIESVNNIRFEGITFECCRSDAFVANGCIGLTIDSCVFKDIGGTAVRITGGRDHLINGCDIRQTGDGGISTDCGNRMTLESGNVRITNNDIHHFSRITRCYRAGISVPGGVGVLISHNRIHDCPHLGIFYYGNDIRMEFNEIYSACMETGDCGAIYSGRDFSVTGIDVVNNYIHHMGGIGDGSSGVYSDDCLSFTKIRDNFFYNTTLAVNSNGGYKIMVENNVFVKCFPAVNMSATGMHPSENIRNMMDVYMKNLLYEKNPLQPPWSDRYPELQEIDAYYKAGPTAFVPASIYFLENILIESHFIHKHWTVKDDMLTDHGTYTGDAPGFEEIEFSDLQILPDSAAIKLGHIPADFHSIGIGPGPRATPVIKAFTSLKLLSVDGTAGEAVLRLSLKNTGTVSVKGRMRIFDMINIEHSGDLTLSVEPGNVKHLDFVVKYKQGLVLEARSIISGVRPCRITL